MKTCNIFIACLICTCLLPSYALATGNIAAFNVTVPPQQFKALRVKNLPRGASVSVEVISTGEIAVAFVDADDYRRLPKPQRPLMAGKVKNRLTFSVVIPADGHYYVVLVNPHTASPYNVTLTVRGERPKSNQQEAADRILREFERQLHRLFIYESFAVRIQQCKKPQAFAAAPGVVLCAEYVKQLYTKIENRDIAKDALTFSVLHEVGRKLMQQWKLKKAEKIDRADEFATVMLVMLNRRQRLQQLAAFFDDHPSVTLSFQKALDDKRHPLSIWRARRIKRHLKNQKLVRAWQKDLIPHMQTKLLLGLRQRSPDWADIDRVNKELAKRQVTSPAPDRKAPEKELEI
jgi:hypothetical protein